MAERCLLHQSKLDSFKEWLVNDGWELCAVKGSYEVLRAKKGKKWIIVFRQLDKTVHYSIRNEDCYLVRRFIKETKSNGI